MGLEFGFVVAALGVVVIASAKSPSDTPSWDMVSLVLPVSGIPLSAEQSEERILVSADGTRKVEVRTTKICRDSAGRIRAEFVPEGESPQSTAFVTLVDPDSAAGSLVILLPAEKKAYRIAAPAPAKGSKLAVGAREGELRAGSPHTKTDDLGTRVLEGIKLSGTRTELLDQKPGSEVTFTERWRSKPLELTGSILVVTPNGSQSAALKHIQRGEPDPALFVIPAGYVIEEVKWPRHVLESLPKP